MVETELYGPVKAFLESQGYQVKGEVNGCDAVATRAGEPPLIVELKTRFSLPLVLQGIDRQRLVDNVYLAVPPFPARGVRRKEALALCRRLGLGLLIVRPDAARKVEPLLDPAEFHPRKRKPALTRLLREFETRVGDPNTGGATRRKIITAYRQDALRCAGYLGEHGPSKAAIVASATGVPRAGNILLKDYYGWFERPPETPRGVYGLTPKGERAALENHSQLDVRQISGRGSSGPESSPSGGPRPATP